MSKFNMAQVDGYVSSVNSTEHGTALNVEIEVWAKGGAVKHTIPVWCPITRPKEGEPVDYVKKYIKVDSGIFVTGRLKTNQKGIFLECSKWSFMGKKKEGDSQPFASEDIPF